jgi:hypothetical protein
MSSSRSMSNRTAALTLALALGALPLASAEAAQRSRRDQAIQQAISVRTIGKALVASLLSVMEKNGVHPGSSKPGSETREGSGVCPNGKPGPQGNPNQRGN